MFKFLRYVGYIVLFLLIIVVAGGFIVRTPDSDLKTAKEKYINKFSKFADDGNGLRVHYRDQGNKDGIPLILIHGSAASLHTFEPLVKQLGDKYRIITYTQPSHGLTGPHPKDDYSFSGMADALNLVVKELKLKKFVLGGNSFGGWVSWRYALKYPDRIQALILLDAWGMPLREGEKAPPSNLAFRLARYSLGRMVLRNYTPRSLVKKSILQTVSVKNIVTEDMIDRYWHLVRLPGNRRAALLRRTTDREIGYASRAGEIKAPTLIIWGNEDRLIYPSAAKSFKERITQAEVVLLDGIGHLPMEESPEKTAQAIDDFLKRTLTQEQQ